MEIAEKTDKLEHFKQAVLDWSASWRNEKRQSELRAYINQNKVWVRQEVIEAHCYHTLTISPPPAIGGLVMPNTDPFAMLFDPPYGMSMVDQVVDMVDQTIGVLNTPAEEITKEDGAARIELDIERNYAFIAMPINPDNPELEDVLDAIQEGASRCNIQAERVDEAQSNERITDRILESINRAEFVIADLSSAKPNVYYEAGYAQGIGKTPLYIARNGTKLEFDLRDYPVIFFKNMKQLKDQLEVRLRAIAEKNG